MDWAHPIFGQIFAACLHNGMVVIYQEVIGDSKRKTWTKCYEIDLSSSLPLDISFCPRFYGLGLVPIIYLILYRQFVVKMVLYIFISQLMLFNCSIGIRIPLSK